LFFFLGGGDKGK